MDELSELVAWFEGDEFELERALETYGKAEKLAAEIEHDLTGLKNEVTVLKEKFDA
jgi:exonuclease VII small subunit